MEQSATLAENFETFFATAPPDLDVGAIRDAWLALKPSYCVADRALPLPIWARRPLTETGPEAWHMLSRKVEQVNADRPLCIYVHIPFCAEKCSFCDCYSFKLGRYYERHTEGYVALLEQEMELWRRLGTLSSRPVTTVHLGGGTPTFLSCDTFTRLIKSCQKHFNTSSQTEWAVESTGTELDKAMRATLEGLGFTRLHLGIQTLDDDIRQVLKRRESSARVLAKTSQALARGWIVSVDLIYGLPGQTLRHLIRDIHTLAAAGVDGFSLYELQSSPHNRKFAHKHGLIHRDRSRNYLLFQAASHMLTALGYRKTLFNHFARERDQNLYFTFPARGEDLLALGTIADGVFNVYHYRHLDYKRYVKTVTHNFPGLQGGLQRTMQESRLYPLEIALFSTKISSQNFAEILGKDKATALLNRWHKAALIAREDPQGRRYVMTHSGSWFIARMIEELRIAFF